MSGIFMDKVRAINEILKNYGPAAVAEVRAAARAAIKSEEREQKTYTGYKVQYVIDAVNDVIGPENWRWEHKDIEATRNPSGKSSSANIAISLYIRFGEEWITKGPVTGDSLNPIEADAMKGALSDGLKKSFAYWSIGNAAYRGELGESKLETQTSAPKSASYQKPEPKPKPETKTKPIEAGPSSDTFIALNDEINDVLTPGLLNEVQDKISRAIADGTLPKGEGAILQARYDKKLRDLKGTKSAH